MEEQNEQEEILNFDQPDYRFEPKQVHGWRQQGPYLVCKTCEIQHAVYIGMAKVMVGINEEGQPILEDRV